MMSRRDLWLSWQPWDKSVLSAVFIWLLCETSWQVHAAGCSKLDLGNTLYQESREGTYQRTSTTCNGRVTYSHTRSQNYIYYMQTSGGWQGWMIGSQDCTNSAGIAVESNNPYPEEASEIWEEVFDNNWYFNSGLTLKCHRMSSGTIVGIILGIVLLIALVAFIAVRYRQRVQRQRMLRQPAHRQPVMTVSGRYPANGPGGPRYPGPRPTGQRNPGGPRPQGPPPPRMRPGYGHGPAMRPGYGHGPMMPDHPQGPMMGPPMGQQMGPPMGPPPSYPGPGGPMAPGYPITMGMQPGPPPPYQANYGSYPAGDTAYPPPPQQPGQPPTHQLQQNQQQQQQQKQLESQSSRNSVQHGHMDDITDTGTKVD